MSKIVARLDYRDDEIPGNVRYYLHDREIIVNPYALEEHVVRAIVEALGHTFEWGPDIRD